ncbi:MAG: DUF2256 domain-containing protein [Acidimicrobiia bacterium]|nr:MAG: DUF2256 domain-containing protein [Acidimicrobiia bacterium]
MHGVTPPPKTCATCGRPFSWRKAWAEDWDAVRYCSKGCRSSKPNRTDRALEEALLTALCTRSEVSTDEAAAAVGDAEWEPLRERARRAARRLAADGRVELWQGGRPVGPNTKGPLAVRPLQGS